MKNVQVIDSAENCTFGIFQATDGKFARLFPEEGQEVQFAEDLFEGGAREQIARVLDNLWERPVRKRDAQGIHGTLFYGLLRYKKYYRESREDGVDPTAVNAPHRRLFGTS